jgi:hypothetical protein
MPTLSSLLLQREVTCLRDLDLALARQLSHGGDLLTNLMEVASLDEAAVLGAMAEASKLPAMPAGALAQPAADALKLVPVDLAQRLACVPVHMTDETLVLAVAEPLASAAEEELAFALARALEQRVCLPVRLAEAQARFYGADLDRRHQRLLSRLQGAVDTAASAPPPATERAAAPPPMPAEPAAPALLVPESPARAPHLAVAPEPQRTLQLGRRRGPFTASMAQEALGGAQTHGVVLRVLFDFARQYFEYTALFVLHGDMAEGVDAAGPGSGATRIRGIGVPIDMPSILASARERCTPVLARPAEDGIDAVLRGDLQRPMTSPVLVVPVVVRTRVVALLYGDDEELPIAMQEVGDVLSLASLVGKALEQLVLRRKRQKETPPPQEGTRRLAPSQPPAAATPPPSPPRHEPYPISAPPAPRQGATRAGGPRTRHITANYLTPISDEPRTRTGTAPPPAFNAERKTGTEPPPFKALQPSAAEPLPPVKHSTEPPPVKAQQPSAAEPLPPVKHSTEPPAPRQNEPAASAEAAPPATIKAVVPPAPASAAASPQVPGVEAVSDQPAPEVAKKPAEPPAQSWSVHIARVINVGMASAASSAAAPLPAAPKKAAVAQAPAPASPAAASVAQPPSVEQPPSTVPAIAEQYANGHGALSEGRGPVTSPMADTLPPGLGSEALQPAPMLQLVQELEEEAPDLLVGEAEDGDEMLETVLAELERTSPEIGTVSGDEALLRESAVAYTFVEEGPREPPKSQPPGDRNLPLVIVDLEGEAEELLTRLMNATDGRVASEARAELLRMGAAAARLVARKFPGPVHESIELDDPELPAASECGPVLDIAVALGQATVLGHVMVAELARLTESADRNTRTWAMLALADIGTDRAVDPVLHGLMDDDPQILNGARRAAVCLASSPAAATPMREAVEHLADSAALPQATRVHGALTLGRMRDPASVPVLIRLLADPEHPVVDAALLALRAITFKDLPASARKWNAWLQQNQERPRLEWLIDALTSASAELRDAAAKELVERTGRDFGYQPDMSAEALANVQARYRVMAAQDDGEPED